MPYAFCTSRCFSLLDSNSTTGVAPLETATGTVSGAKVANPDCQKTLLAGFEQAYDRWMAGLRLDPDPEQAFFGIFEALNWAVATTA
jgi:hypothetical protein